jgi:hypothetical protein
LHLQNGCAGRGQHRETCPFYIGANKRPSINELRREIDNGSPTFILSSLKKQVLFSHYCSWVRRKTSLPLTIGEGAWTLKSAGPKSLTLIEEIACRACGLRGSITKGKWVAK